MTHNQIILTIIIGAGLLGGLTNFFRLYKLDYQKKECWINFAKAILMSLCASLTVPLFLQTISSNLIDFPETGKYPDKNYFIIAGFCVIAAFFSKRFLEDLYDKVNNLEKKTDETKKELQDTVKRAKEVDKKVGDIEESMEDNIPTDIKDTLMKNSSLSLIEDDAQKIITVLFSSKYSFRTISGIQKATSITEDKIKKALEHLLEMGFAERKVSYKGTDLWRLLIYPIRIYSASYGVPGNLLDVTDRIRELVSNGVNEGPVDPSTFRVPDPAWGVVKYLRIHCRIRGKETELSFKDGQTFKII